MDVKEAIEKRRAFRSLEPVEITDAMVEDLASCAQLSASCFNNQPWRFVFVKGSEALEKIKGALNKGNAWARSASMIVVVISKKDKDCIMPDGREYFLFDTGMATAHLILRATELGLIAHPIAGYDQQKAKEAIGLPPEYTVVTLVNVGRKSDKLNPVLSEKQIAEEGPRPARKPLNTAYAIDSFNSALE